MRGLPTLLRVSCLLLIAVVMMGWLLASTGRISGLQCLYLLLLPWTLASLGCAVLSLLRFRSTLTTALPAGAVIAGCLVFALKVVLPIPMWGCAVALLGCAVLAPRLIERLLGRRPRLRVQRAEVTATAFCLAAATLWCSGAFRPMVWSDHTVVFRPWVDWFKHANIVGMFLEPASMLGLGNYECLGQPWAFYHYGSYAFPALLAGLGPTSGYEALAASWAPLGFFLVGLTAYTLGRSLAGPAGGLAAAAAVLCVPDPAILGLAHPYYGFHWLLQIGCGCSYGVASAGLALLLTMQAARRRSWRLLAGAVGFLGATALLKVHFVIPLFPLLALWSVVAGRGWRLRTRLALIAATVTCCLLAVLASERFAIGPTLRFDGSGAPAFLPDVVRWWPHHPVPHFERFGQGAAVHGHLLRAIVLAAWLGLGGYFLAAPLIFATAYLCGVWEARALVPAATVVLYLGLVFGLALNTRMGTTDEILHRPFLWMYFLVASFSGAYVVRLTRSVRGARSKGASATAGAAWALLLFPYLNGGDLVQANAHRLPWGSSYVNTAVPRGLVECATFIRTTPGRKSVLQDSQLDTDMLVVGGLAERSSFLARPAFWAKNPACARAKVGDTKRAVVQGLMQAKTLSSLQGMIRSSGIRWLLRHPGDPFAAADSGLAQPCFSSQGFEVYDLQTLLRSGHGGTIPPAGSR